MKIENFTNSKNVACVEEMGVFKIMEHQRDLSLFSPAQALQAYYMEAQNIRKRQIVATLNDTVGVILSPGCMQWISGKIKSVTDVKGVGDLFKKAIKGKVTKEAAINPLYKGTGVVTTEPTYKYLLLEDVGEHGGLVVADGMFLACEDTLTMDVVMAKTLSGALLGGQGIFNLCLRGRGVAVLESPIPRGEIIKVTLTKGEEVQIDGPYALMWDDELTMSVEKSGKSLIGSAVSGEGFVNVFRGEGSVWMSTAAASPK